MLSRNAMVTALAGAFMCASIAPPVRAATDSDVFHCKINRFSERPGSYWSVSDPRSDDLGCRTFLLLTGAGLSVKFFAHGEAQLHCEDGEGTGNYLVIQNPDPTLDCETHLRIVEQDGSMTPSNHSCGSARSAAVEIVPMTMGMAGIDMNAALLPESVKSVIDERRDELVVSALDAVASARIARDMNDSITDMAFIDLARQAVVKARRFSALAAYRAWQYQDELELLNLVSWATDVGNRTQELLGAALKVRDECGNQKEH